MLSRIWTLTKVELYKLSRQKLFYIGLCLVLAVVALSVLTEKPAGDAKAPVNGFGPLVAGCLNGFRITVFLILVIGGLLFASETTFGTLKTILIAPIRRSDLILAKVLSVIITAITFTLLIEASALILSWAMYGFAAITDPTFPEMVHLSKADMLIFTIYTFLHIVLPLITIGLMGLFISTLVENSGIAVAISIIIYLVLDFFMVGLFENLSSYLFNYYLNYYLATLKDISEGVMQEIWKFKAIGQFLGVKQEDVGMIDAARKFEVIKSLVIPVIYSIIFIISSIIAVNRKNS